METEVTKLVDASNLREELRQHGPNTILIRNVLRHWVLGNQATDPIITLARRNGKMTAIILKQTDSGGTTWWQIFTPDSQPNEDLQTLLTHHIDWSRDSLFFSSVPVAFQPLLHEIAAKQGVELMETDYQQKLYAVRDRKRQQRLLSSARSELPQSYSLMKNIDSKWANFIDGLWEYRGNTSIVLIEHILRKNMAIGVIHEPSQQLVGWFLMQETGCQGILHVTEEHRGKGIAQVLVREMQETLLGLNLEPVSVILDTNEPSYRLFRKCGYDAEHSVFWAFRKQHFS